MNELNYIRNLKKLWNRAVREYSTGNRNVKTYYDLGDLSFLRSVGIKPIEIYDYAEDYVKYGEPSFTSFITVHTVRTNYFEQVQKGRASDQVISPESLPGRDEEAAGIPWLPRIIEKARGKLSGELDADIMYGCPADRRFFKEHGISASIFLKIVWDAGDDTLTIIEWVAVNSKQQELYAA